MASLKKCPDCGHMISKKASACPSCGRKLKRKSMLFGCFGFTFLLFVAFILLIIIIAPKSGVKPAARPGGNLIPEVAAFLQAHDEFGSAVSSSDVPNWASGKRQNVVTDKGFRLLFYEKGGKIVTVYENDPPKPRTVVWGEQDH